MDHPAAATGADRDAQTGTRPASIIGSACQALIATVHKISADVTNFVRRCRSSRADLAPVTRELSELLMVLQLLDDYDARAAGTAMPEELQAHLRPVLTNCGTVAQRIDAVLDRHAVAAAGWTAAGRDEVDELAKSLGVHRALMGLVADLTAVSVSRRRSSGGEEEQLEVAAVLEELRALGSSIVISYSNATLAREHFALQVHLGQIVAYAETLVRSELWEDAVKELDGAAGEGEGEGDSPDPSDVRTSTVPAPLRRNLSAESDVTAVGIPNRGLEKLLSPGPPGANRPASTFSSPNRTPEPDASADGRAPATGFFVMDGFLNSDHGYNATTLPVQLASQDRWRKDAGVPKTGSRSSSRGTRSPRQSGEEAVGASRAAPAPMDARYLQEARSRRPSASGLEVAIPDEKEVNGAYEGEGRVSEEALAFAQVPVHVLGRLSVNLAGHPYNDNSSRGEGSDQASYDPSLSTIKTAEVEDEGDYDDTASNGTNALGGHLQFSQADISKLPLSESRSQSESSSPLSSDRTNDSNLRPPSHASPNSRSNSQSVSGARPPPPPPPPGDQQGLREMLSKSTMNTQNLVMQKPLPKAPIVKIPGYPGPFIKKKAVVVGNFSCGKTCLITRMAKGHYPKNKTDKCSIMETVRIAVDEEPMELSLWDIRGIDYDPTWLNGAHVALVCFSVNIGSTDSKGKHLGRWVAEVNRNCPGAAILLVGLKSDIRFHARSVEKLRRSGKSLVTPEQGEQFRGNIGASRYLECSARTGDGVLEVLGETARVAMQVSKDSSTKGQARPLSRIGKFFGLGGGKKAQDDG